MSPQSASASPIMAIDPSLNSLGIAYRHNGRIIASRVTKGDAYRGLTRISVIREVVTTYLDMYAPSLVVYEGYALGFRGKSNTIFDLGELGGVLKLLILERGIDILLVPPTTLKAYVTGKGNADKQQVALALQEELGVSFATSDQYDATGLLVMGEAYLNKRLLPRDRKHYKCKAIKGCAFLPATRSRKEDFEIDCK